MTSIQRFNLCINTSPLQRFNLCRLALIIKGNVKTKDAVIRREMKIVPGEHFDGKKLRRSKENLYNLGFFEEVTYDTEPTAVPDKQDMIVNVKEAKTGELSFGAGYSTVQDFVGFAEIKQNNFDLFNFPTFTGGGQNLKLRGEVGTVRKDYELSFTEPWIFDRDRYSIDVMPEGHTLEDYL